MIWMILFWIFLVVYTFSIIISFKGNRNIKDRFSDVSFFALIFMILSIGMSIITHDPFFEWLPIFNAIQQKGWEVAFSVVLSGVAIFFFWIYLKHEYIVPIKDDVTNLKTETSRIDERTKNIQEDVRFIKESCIPLKNRR